MHKRTKKEIDECEKSDDQCSNVSMQPKQKQTKNRQL